MTLGLHCSVTNVVRTRVSVVAVVGGSYADQLSAFMTPAAGQGMMGQASEMGSSHGDVDWAAHYGVRLEA